jgi:sulfonate transport system permease protein
MISPGMPALAESQLAAGYSDAGMLRAADAALSAIVPVTLVAVWELSVRFGWLPSTLIAAPSAVIVDAWLLATDGKLGYNAYISLARLAGGFAIGMTLALVLGSLVGLFRLAERLISPTIQILSPIPVVAWIPLFIIFFHIDGSRIALIATGTFWIVFFGVVQGIRSADAKLVEVAYLYNKPALDILLKLLLPAALPNILGALRIALGLSWVLLLTAEMIASSSGLGWLIWDSRNFSRPDDMIVGMISVGVLGALTDRSVALLQRRVLRWRSTFDGR